MFDMKRLWLALICLVISAPFAAAAEVEENAFGLYHQDWFLESFLDLKEDFQGAVDQGKRFVILWEQRGCPYCKDLHAINFAQDDIRQYAKDNFVVVQMNIWGDREVTDFDGEVLTEKALAAKNAVAFTPTMQFLPQSLEALSVKKGAAMDVARLPGYFRPFHFKAMLRYVNEKMYETDKTFQAYIVELAQSGKKP
jgi:thioredoxin-related protein